MTNRAVGIGRLCNNLVSRKMELLPFKGNLHIFPQNKRASLTQDGAMNGNPASRENDDEKITTSVSTAKPEASVVPEHLILFRVNTEISNGFYVLHSWCRKQVSQEDACCFVRSTA